MHGRGQPRDAGVQTPARRLLSGLSGRLLAFTAIIIMLIEVVIFVPSLASFQRTWLQDKVNSAGLALLAVQEARDSPMMEAVHRDLLERVGVARAELRQRPGSVVIVLATSENAIGVEPRRIDLRRNSWFASIRDAFAVLFSRPGGFIEAVAQAQNRSDEVVAILLMQDALRADLLAFAERIFSLSLLISALTAGLVYFALDRTIVRPIQRLTEQILRFRDSPQDNSTMIRPSGRGDELGQAEVALAEMEHAVRSALTQQQRLAALGAAVARLAHDLRNSLATAQIVSDRLASSDDPKVRLVAPRLERALLRASKLAEAALRYGKAEEPPPRMEPVGLAAALAEAAADALAGFPQVPFFNQVGGDVIIRADRDQLHRILVNLMRNAAQAMTAETDEDEPAPRPPRLGATAHFEHGMARIRIEDAGPGLPAAMKAKLFQPFSSAHRGEGSGLGLAIARELARSQGGDLELAASGPDGAAFDLRLPLAHTAASVA